MVVLLRLPSGVLTKDIRNTLKVASIQPDYRSAGWYLSTKVVKTSLNIIDTAAREV